MGWRGKGRGGGGSLRSGPGRPSVRRVCPSRCSAVGTETLPCPHTVPAGRGREAGSLRRHSPPSAPTRSTLPLRHNSDGVS